MSRTSLQRRMLVVEQAMKQQNPRGYALYHLTPMLQRWHEDWRTTCERIATQFHNSYEALLSGDAAFPPMPPRVAAALGIEPAASIPLDASLADAAEMYRKSLQEYET